MKYIWKLRSQFYVHKHGNNSSDNNGTQGPVTATILYKWMGDQMCFIAP